MRLELDFEIVRDRVPLAGPIMLRTTLRNLDEATVEVASLFDNNRITNYVVFDDEHREIATVNHVTRQTLMEKVEPRTEDERIIRLAPGAAELREDNLSLYYWFLRPGRYHLRARYVWKGCDLWSDPVALEVLPAPVLSRDHQWGHHYGEKFVLHSSWVLPREDGMHELFFRESMRFRPQVVNVNPVLLELSHPVDPRVSFNRTMIAGSGVWIGWLQDDRLFVLKTRGGVVTAGPVEHTLPFRDTDWVTAPITSRAEDLVVLVSGRDGDAGRRILALRLRPDGTEEQRAFIDAPLTGAVQVHAACDPDGVGVHLFLLTSTNEIVHLFVDLATLQAGSPTRVWRAPGQLVGLMLPPVVDDEAFFCSAHTDDRYQELHLAWLQLEPSSNPLKVQSTQLPGDPTDPPETRAVSSCSGEMNTRGHPFVLVTTPAGVLYVNGALMQSRLLAAPGDLLPPIEPRLAVNDRDDVFFIASRRPFGLTETLVHTGVDAEHGEIE